MLDWHVCHALSNRSDTVDEVLHSKRLISLYHTGAPDATAGHCRAYGAKRACCRVQLQRVSTARAAEARSPFVNQGASQGILDILGGSWALFRGERGVESASTGDQNGWPMAAGRAGVTFFFGLLLSTGLVAFLGGSPLSTPLHLVSNLVSCLVVSISLLQRLSEG